MGRVGTTEVRKRRTARNGIGNCLRNGPNLVAQIHRIKGFWIGDVSLLSIFDEKYCAVARLLNDLPWQRRKGGAYWQ